MAALIRFTDVGFSLENYPGDAPPAIDAYQAFTKQFTRYVQGGPGIEITPEPVEF
jgi:hypothetical protein